jgi:hypothetical protein
VWIGLARAVLVSGAELAVHLDLAALVKPRARLAKAIALGLGGLHAQRVALVQLLGGDAVGAAAVAV